MQSALARPADRKQFTVGIICALAVEASAVKALFDVTYDIYSRFYRKPRNDPNVYFNGRMGKANVVLCKSPRPGKSAAASVISNLMTTYPNINKVLLVGICGGLPSLSGKRERSLGDVIVSDSMVVYDFGKQYADGFHLADETLHVHKFAEAALLDSFNMFDVRQDMEVRLSSHLCQLRDNKAWSETEEQPEHAVEDPRTAMVRTDTTDSSWRGSLPSDSGSMKAPKLHIGRMASADRVVKSEVHRDDLAKEHGAIGFEMEGGGIWDYSVPCIIVKGISDWADHRKNDDWHFYAAATGASAAKVLIDYLTPNEDTEKVKYWMVPFLYNPDFVGRQREIQQIEDMIFSPKGPTKVALSGLGGIGKTQVALQLAYRARDRDNGCPVIWIPCTSVETIEQNYVTAAKVLGLDTTSPEEAKEYLKAQLSDNFTKWLLILDNVDDPAVWETLKEVLPQSQEGRILITTRNQRVAVEAASSHIVSIKAPDKQTAINILSKKLVEKALLNDSKIMITLLEKLAYLPLAIIQAASYLNGNTGKTLLEYMELLDGQESKAVELLNTEFTDEGRYDRSLNPVAATWLVSFNQIMNLDANAADYLRLMACVDRLDIPKGFLPPLESDKKTFEALGLLGAFSFVVRNYATGYFTLHRLVHLATRNWMRHNNQFAQYLHRAADRLEEVYPDDGESDRRMRGKYLPHAMSLISEEEFQEAEHDGLLRKIARGFLCDDRHNDAQDFFTRTLTIRQRRDGAEEHTTITSMIEVATTYRSQGKLEEAEDYGKRALVASKEVLGPGHPDTIHATTALAAVYKIQGKWEEADELDLVMVDALTQGEYGPDELTYMSTIASGLKLRGRTQKAEELHLQILDLQRTRFGSDHPDTLESMRCLSSIYISQSRMKEAKGMLLCVIETCNRNPKSRTDPGIKDRLKLAEIYLELDETRQAEQLVVWAVNAAKEIFGPQNPNTLSAMSTLAFIYQLQKKFEDAEILLQQVLEGVKEQYGSDQFRLTAAMMNISNNYRLQGNKKEMDNWRERAFKVRTREDVLGPRHPEVIRNMAVFANGLAASGSKHIPYRLMARAVDLANEVLGPDHPDTEYYTSCLSQMQQEVDRVLAAAQVQPEPAPAAPHARRLGDRLRLRNVRDKAWKLFRG
ncbi:hypothetical protein BDV06DRAFT_39310 [Aspergillus oleicola]